MVSQLILNALISGSLYALIGVGFSLIFRVSRFFHFTYALIYTLGAYATFALAHWMHLPTLGAFVGGLLIVALIGLTLDLTVYGPLRERSASSLVLLVVSIGLYIVGQNLLSVAFGDGVLSIRSHEVIPGIEVFDARVTHAQLVIVISAIASISAIWVWLFASRQGRQIQAVGEDLELARIVGISTRRAIMMVAGVGSAIGGLAGNLSALDRDMVPTMGMQALLAAVTVMIVGGQNSILGIALGGLLLGLAQNLALLWIPSAWQEAIAFFVLIIFLLFRPHGFFGKPLRQASV